MNHKQNIYYILVYFIITFLIYRYVFGVFKLGLNLPMYAIFLLLFFSYYLFNTLDFRVDFKFKDFLYNTILNLVAFSVFYFFNKNMSFYSAFLIYTCIQNILSYILHRYRRKKINVLVVDNGEYLQSIKEILINSHNYNFIGYVNDEDITEGRYYLGSVKGIKGIVKKYGIDGIVFTKNKQMKEYADLLVSVKLRGLRMIDYFLFLEEFEGKIDTDKIDSVWVLMTDSFNNCGSNMQKRLKRVIDLVLSLILFIIFLPFMAITYVMVKCDIGLKYIFTNPMKIVKNPAFFKQKRIGYRGREFEMVKFRSMKVHDPSKYSKYASEHDERITKVGKFIRKTRFDELPQIINVINGSMSFVGPRPEWNVLGETYEKEIKNYDLRYAVQPGITGWAQTMYTYGASVDDAKIKLGYDLYYVKNQSLILDIIILFKTTKIVLFGKGM